MTALAYTLQGLVLASYLGATVVYVRFFQTGARELRWLCRPALLIVLAFHAAYLGLLGWMQGTVPLIAPGQATTVTAASITAIYLGIEIRLDRRVMGAFVLGLALLFQLVSVFLSVHTPEVPAALQSVRLPAHALAGLVGYAALGLGGVFSLLLLMLRGHIKRRQIGVLYQRLPSIRVLDTMSKHANTTGFALLTLALASGALWAAHEWDSLFPRDPKLLGIAGVWLLYAVYLLARFIPGFNRRIRAYWSLGSFALLTVNFTLVDFLVESRHSW